MQSTVFSAANAAQASYRFSKQKGVVLPLALFLLIVISIAGIMAISNSSQSEKTNQSLRNNALAQQSAEIGLRYCENIVMEKVDGPAVTYYSAQYGKIKEDVVLTSENDTSAIWRTAVNWKSGQANRIEVPTTSYKKGVSGDLKNGPLCMAQKLGTQSYLITARGFGNDALFDSNGKTLSGGEVWLQSVISPQF